MISIARLEQSELGISTAHSLSLSLSEFLAQVLDLVLDSSVSQLDHDFAVFFDGEFTVGNQIVLPIHWIHELHLLRCTTTGQLDLLNL